MFVLRHSERIYHTKKILLSPLKYSSHLLKHNDTVQLSVITVNELVIIRIQSTTKQGKKRTHYFIPEHILICL